MATKKRNSQDATRKEDVAPLRRRIEKLEASNKTLKTQVKVLEMSVKGILSLPIGAFKKMNERKQGRR